jgi:hypothetical protein
MISTVNIYLFDSYFFDRNKPRKTVLVSLKMGAEITACAIDFYFSS